MYPRNAASPEPVAIGPVVQISDGAVQSSGVTVRIKPVGVSEADGAGTTAYSTDGVVLYTPTQAETNYTSFVLIAKKTGCIPAAVTVVTTASATAGYAGLDWSKLTAATTAVALTNTTISASQVVASVTNRVTANTDQWGSVEVTGMPLPTTSYTAPPTAEAIADAVWDEIMSTHTVNGSYGSHVVRSANQNRNTVAITVSQHVAADIHDMQAAVITADKFAANWLTAAGTAADYITELQAAIGTAANQTTILDRVSFCLSALAGNCSDAQTATETYVLSIGGNTFTVDFSGLDASGNRSTTTLTKA